MKKILIGMSVLLLAGCARNIEEAKRCAPDAAKAMGFELAGYTGYNLTVIYGGLVWYNLKKVPDNGIVYEAAFSPWGGECHVYNLRAIDAIKPTL